MVAVNENDAHRLLDKVMTTSSMADVTGTSFVILGLLDCGDVSGTCLYPHSTPIGQLREEVTRFSAGHQRTTLFD